MRKSSYPGLSERSQALSLGSVDKVKENERQRESAKRLLILMKY